MGLMMYFKEARTVLNTGRWTLPAGSCLRAMNLSGTWDPAGRPDDRFRIGSFQPIR